MAEVTFDVNPTTPRKRSYDDTIVVDCGTVPAVSQTNPGPSDYRLTRAGSPALSTSSSLTELTMSNDPGSAVKSSSSATKSGPSKKRKLGFFEAQAEKLAKQREKEEKAKQKADEKTKKDEERRRSAEEKENARVAKELERAEKQKAKDDERQKKDADKALKDADKARKDAEKRAKDAEKEAEKERKEADKLRRERSQMRLGAFFAKPKAENTPPSTPDDVSEGVSSRRSSIASIDAERQAVQPSKTPLTNPDYERCFLPFFVPEYTDVAPMNKFTLGKSIDFEISNDTHSSVLDIQEHFGRPKKRMKRTVPVKEVVKNMQATGLDLVELDDVALDVLAKASYKCLQFREDVRPPYQGTFTRAIAPRISRKISRKPFARDLPDINYDYDSEAEWEPPAEDDEDLDEDDEMSDADEAGDDIVDFLDDADDMIRKKGPLSDMEPVSSGLCWVDQPFDDHGTNLEQYRVDVLHDSTVLPIDPYSDQHWQEDVKQKPMIKQELVATQMLPPRNPLSMLSPNATPATIKSEFGVDGKPLPVATHKKPTIAKNPKMIEPEHMDAFKHAISGSDLTKLGLIEVLKKQFPSCSKEAIRDTLNVVASRVGKKEAEKKWEVNDSI